MRSLSARCTMLRGDERGAVSVIVAILLVPVLLGVAAFAVDGGSLYLGRQNAQNAADAAALALAKSCASNSTYCTENLTDSGLSSLVKMNVNPGSGALDSLCIRKSGSGCTDSNLTNLSQCPYSLSSVSQGVQVRVRADIKLFFAPIWGVNSAEPGACSSATWGKIGSLKTTLPITFSACEWSRATGGDPYDPSTGNYPPPPPYPPYPTGYERIIYLQDKSRAGQSCTTFNGHDSPGGFGWVSGASGQCGAVVVNGSWIHIDTGNNTPSDCTPLFAGLKTSTNPVVYVPIYDCMRSTDPGPGVVPPASWDCSQGSGSNTYYHIVGYAKFYVTGWYLSSGSKASPNLGVPCTGGDRCLSGYFLKGLATEGEMSTDPTVPDFGADQVKMVG